MLDFVYIPLLAIHLVLLNISCSAPLICIALERKFNRQVCCDADRLGRKLAIESVVCLVWAAGFGIVLGGLNWIDSDSDFANALSFFWNRIWWGVWELLFFVACMWIYIRMWKASNSIAYRILHRFIAVLAATNLLYHFPILFTAIANHRSLEFEEAATSSQFRQVAFRADVLILALHFGIASFAVGGLRLIQLANGISDAKSQEHFVKKGARLALFCTALQFVVGFWLLAVVPNSRQLLGENEIATSCFFVAILLSFWLLNQLVFVSFGQVERHQIRNSFIAMGLVIFLMTIVLRLLT